MEDNEKSPELYKREKLYDEVWAEPVKIVAQRYGVSDVGLAKTCGSHLDISLGLRLHSGTPQGSRESHPPAVPVSILGRAQGRPVPAQSGSCIPPEPGRGSQYQPCSLGSFRWDMSQTRKPWRLDDLSRQPVREVQETVNILWGHIPHQAFQFDNSRPLVAVGPAERRSHG